MQSRSYATHERARNPSHRTHRSSPAAPHPAQRRRPNRKHHGPRPRCVLRHRGEDRDRSDGCGRGASLGNVCAASERRSRRLARHERHDERGAMGQAGQPIGRCRRGAAAEQTMGRGARAAAARAMAPLTLTEESAREALVAEHDGERLGAEIEAERYERAQSEGRERQPADPAGHGPPAPHSRLAAPLLRAGCSAHREPNAAAGVAAATLYAIRQIRDERSLVPERRAERAVRPADAPRGCPARRARL